MVLTIELASYLKKMIMLGIEVKKISNYVAFFANSNDMV